MIKYLILIALLVVGFSLFRRIMQVVRMIKNSVDFQQMRTGRGRGAKKIDSTVRDVKSSDYRDKRLKILQQMQSGELSAEEAQRKLDELDQE
jgi:hypothetical protein